MACFSPLSAWQTDDGEIVFSERGSIRRSLELPCGQCVGCRLERSRQWAIRCLHESQLYDFNLFVTLTYNDDNLPSDGSLRYSDFQKFMRRVRKCFGHGVVRFYMCGEYGDLTKRPHYHAILFNCWFADRVFHKFGNSGERLYVSPKLDKLWELGDCYIGDVTFESAAYVARYCMKKITGVMADEHYKRVSPDGEVYWLVPEFNKMSLKPGIGARWFAKYMRDVFPHDRVVVRGKLMRPPRYYDLLGAMLDGRSFTDIEFERLERFKTVMLDNSPDRLVAREAVLRAGMTFKGRNFL